MGEVQEVIRPSYLAEIERTFAKFLCGLLSDKILNKLEKANKNKDARFLIDILISRESIYCEGRDETPFVKRVMEMTQEYLASNPELCRKIDGCKRRLRSIRKELNKPAHDHDKKDDPEFQKKVATQIEKVIESMTAPDSANEYLERLHEICDSMGIETQDKMKFLDMREKLDLVDKDISEIKKKYAARKTFLKN